MVHHNTILKFKANNILVKKKITLFFLKIKKKALLQLLSHVIIYKKINTKKNPIQIITAVFRMKVQFLRHHKKLKEKSYKEFLQQLPLLHLLKILINQKTLNIRLLKFIYKVIHKLPNK